MMMEYRLALQLFKLYNLETQTALNWQQNYNMRNNYVQILDFSNLRIGKNCLIQLSPLVRPQLLVNDSGSRKKYNV